LIISSAVASKVGGSDARLAASHSSVMSMAMISSYITKAS
jgi:hypothetical protein